jgi:hypothetical protein
MDVRYFILLHLYGKKKRLVLTHPNIRRYDEICVSQCNIYVYYRLSVVPHKAVVEVSRIGHCRRDESLLCMGGRASPLMDRKVVGVVFFGVVAMVAVVTSPQVLDVVWYSAVVVVGVVVVLV